MIRPPLPRTISFVLLCLTTLMIAAHADDFFEAKVRPLLLQHCIDCHGGKRLKSNFSLIDRENLLRGGELGAAVDLEHADRSALLSAVRYDDPELQMPPRGKLSDDEIATLAEWIERGAPWTEGEAGRLGEIPSEEHTGLTITDENRAYWAYRPLERPAVPAAAGFDHPIDRFIAARLEAAEIEASPRADDAALIRRVTYDLTGLPPTPEEVRRYVEDSAPNKWEQLVERLLASPRYGEKWARHWLDLVRYAETNGYERDNTKLNMWRYRDWVIRAFNQDKRYNRFIVEQLAGDELPDADADTRIATGYHRLMIWDDEPIDRKQSRYDVLADIVDTTGHAFMGTTLGCARCHDHKKDPITQADYYRVMAFFNNLTDHGTGKAITRPVQDPQRPGENIWSVAERDARRRELETELDTYYDQLRTAWAGAGRRVEEEHRELVPTSQRDPQTWRYTFEEQEPGWEAQAFDDNAWATGPGGFGRRGTPGSKIGTEWTTKRVYLRRNFVLTEIPETLAITYHHDDDLSVWVNGVPILERDRYRTSYETIVLPREARDALVVGSNSLAVECEQDFGGQYVDVGLGSGFPPHEIRGMWLHRLRHEGERFLGAETHSRAMAILDELDRIAKQPVRAPYPAAIAFERGREPRVQHVHLRGSANAPGDEVQPGYPEVLVPEGQHLATIPVPWEGLKSTGRRLAFARWLVGDGRSLTARVMANRIWQFHFGRGIVRSSSDFGLLGTGPTHPELLDYLAAEFINGYWSIKSLHRFILTSETYRRSSRPQPSALERDPRNDLFARFDMRRLTAEEIRDSVLAVNGTLNPEMYGPSIYTKLPREVLETSSRPNQAWGKSSPDQQDRRSIYIFVKRSLREAFLETFDQADTDSSCAVRFVTHVPTQTLTMLNSAFLHEEAGELADRLLREVGGRLDQQIERGLALGLARTPTADEIERNVEFVERLRREHELDERESLRFFALALYNLNEFLFLD